MPKKVLKPCRMAVIITVILISTDAVAQSCPWAIGTFHSPKGFGFCTEQFRQGSRETFSAYADLDLILEGVSSTPGFHFSYLHENDILSGTPGFADSYSLFFGIGASTGYVRDRTPSIGIIAGPAFSFGSRFVFLERLSLSLYFQAEIAVHISFNESERVHLSYYKNGLIRSYLPQLKISYVF